MLVDFTTRRNNCVNKKNAAKKQKTLLGGEKRAPFLQQNTGCPLSPLYHTKRQKLSSEPVGPDVGLSWGFSLSAPGQECPGATTSSANESVPNRDGGHPMSLETRSRPPPAAFFSDI